MAGPWERDWSGAKVMGGTGNAGKLPTGYQPTPAGGLTPTRGGPDYLDKTLQTKKAFGANQVVSDYRTQVPILASAASAPPTPAGDLDLIYAAGKILDPGSVVREGEMAMVGQTAPVVSQLVGRFSKEFSEKGYLQPRTRAQLVQMLGNRVSQTARAYNSQRSDYGQTSKALGLDPKLVVGPHPGDDLVRAGLANYSGSGLNRGKLGLPFIVKSERDYARVPAGARYTDPNGVERVKGRK